MRVRGAIFVPGQRYWYYTTRRYQGRRPKWVQSFSGPYTIVEQCEPVKYKLQRSPRARIVVAHVDELRPCFDAGDQNAREVLSAFSAPRSAHDD